MQYWQIYRNWLLKLINERLYLADKGFRTDLKRTANQLKNLIDANGYRNDRTLASFIIRKHDEIKELIPNNKAYVSQIEKLKMAVETGKTFIQNS